MRVSDSTTREPRHLAHPGYSYTGFRHPVFPEYLKQEVRDAHDGNHHSPEETFRRSSARSWFRSLLGFFSRSRLSLLHGWHRPSASPARLELIERVQLSPKQSLVLVEADGRRLLLATSADGAAVFFSLEDQICRPDVQPKSWPETRAAARPETHAWQRHRRRSW